MSLPIGPYKDFAACVAANQDKGDPKAYCGQLEADAKKGLYRIAKWDEPQRRVYGWASVIAEADGAPLIDHQGDIIELPELESAMVDFMANSRETNAMHAGPATSNVFEAFVGYPEKYEAMGVPAEVAKTLPTGAWIGVQTDEPTFAKVKDGTLRMFSIEGKAVPEPV